MLYKSSLYGRIFVFVSVVVVVSSFLVERPLLAVRPASVKVPPPSPGLSFSTSSSSRRCNCKLTLLAGWKSDFEDDDEEPDNDTDDDNDKLKNVIEDDEDSLEFAKLFESRAAENAAAFVASTSSSSFVSSSSPSDASVLSSPSSTTSFIPSTTSTATNDLSAIRTRQFSLGADLVLSNYLGNMGFEEVTDWEYYYQDEEDPTNRKVVQPNIPFSTSEKDTTATSSSNKNNDSNNQYPKRTRTSSGSVVRLFRGEWVGPLGGMLGSQGLDRRVLVKEFFGDLALQLAESELKAVAKLQSKLLVSPSSSSSSQQQQPKDLESIRKGEWVSTAAARSVKSRQDNANVVTLIKLLRTEPYVGILGEVNLAELEEDDDDDGQFRNDFYRALGVPPPKPGAIWIVYEYTGLSSIQTYASQPPELRRRSSMTAASTTTNSNNNRGGGFFSSLFGGGGGMGGSRGAIPPPLPPFQERAAYVVKGIMKGAIEAVANLHESGLVHRSIGRSSLILSSKSCMDKRQTSSPYATLATQKHQLVVKLADFGFSSSLYYSNNNKDEQDRSSTIGTTTSKMDDYYFEEFCARARTFGLYFPRSKIGQGDRKNAIAMANFAMAEDMHALGFVFLGLLLTSLAELPSSSSSSGAESSTSLSDLSSVMPAITDEDSLQRLLSDIFDKDFEQFREYIEAEDVWSSLVELLDKNNGAGWTVLETLMLAREKAAKTKDSLQIFSIRGLLANPFFTS